MRSTMATALSGSSQAWPSTASGAAPGVAVLVAVVAVLCVHACRSNVACVRRLSSFRRGASCSVTTSTVPGSDRTILAVNGSTVSDMRTNRSASCSARASDGRSA